MQPTNFRPKSYMYLSYAPDGTFMGRWADVISDFTMSQDLNSAGVAVQVTLGRSIDDALNNVSNLGTENLDDLTTEALEILQIDTLSRNRVGTGTDVDVYNRVDIFVFYEEHEILVDETGDEIVTDTNEEIYLISPYLDGRKIFTGIIEDLEAEYGAEDKVVVTLLSDGYELDNYLIMNGANTTRTFAGNDPSVILKTILDNYAGNITYDSGSIQTTSTFVTYTFKMNTVLEGVRKCVEMAPADWYWWVDPATQLMNFKTRSLTPDHTFYLGRHISSLKIKKTMSNIVNDVYFLGGDTGGGVYLYKNYNDPTSITNYGRRLNRITDQRVTNATSASIIANSLINDNDEPKYSGEVTIVSQVYPIEDIALGDVIAFKNFDNFLDDVQLLVAGFNYNPDQITLRLETLPPSQNKRLEDIRRNLQREETLNVPNAPS